MARQNRSDKVKAPQKSSSPASRARRYNRRSTSPRPRPRPMFVFNSAFRRRMRRRFLQGDPYNAWRRQAARTMFLPDGSDFNPDFPSFSGPPFQKDYDPVDSDDEEPVEWHGFKKSRKASRAPAQSSGSSQPRNKTCRNNSRQAADPEIIRVGQSTTNASQQRLASTGAAIDRIARSSSARASEDNSHNQQRGTKRRADDEEERDEPAPKRAKGGANPGTDRGGNEVHPLATNTQKKNSQLRTTGGGKSPKRD